MQMPAGGRRIRGGRQVSRSTSSAPAFATRLLSAWTRLRFAASTESVRRPLHLGGDLHFFADRLARVGFESVCGRTTAGFRRSAVLFSFAAEPLREEKDLVAMPARFVGGMTRLIGAQSHSLCKATQLLRIDAVGLGPGPSLFRGDARDLSTLATSLTLLPLLLSRRDRRLPGLY